MSSGWSGPGGKSSAANEDENRMYKATKAKVQRAQQEKRDSENLRRASEGLPPSRSTSRFFLHRV